MHLSNSQFNKLEDCLKINIELHISRINIAAIHQFDTDLHEILFVRSWDDHVYNVFAAKIPARRYGYFTYFIWKRVDKI